MKQPKKPKQKSLEEQKKEAIQNGDYKTMREIQKRIDFLNYGVK